jgi:hypothetical protein
MNILQPIKSKADLQKLRKRLKAKKIPYANVSLKSWKYGIFLREKDLPSKKKKWIR